MRKIFFGQRDGSGGAILGFTEVDGAFFQVHLAARQGLDLAGTYTIKRLYISMTYRDARCLICITMHNCAGLIHAKFTHEKLSVNTPTYCSCCKKTGAKPWGLHLHEIRAKNPTP
jgi:hypothetical protein